MYKRFYSWDKVFLILLVSFYTMNFGQVQNNTKEEALILEYIEKGNIDGLRELADAIDIDKEYGGWTLLMWASNYGHLDIVYYLSITKKASKNYSSLFYNHTALMVAAEKGHLEIVKFFEENRPYSGVDIDAWNKRGDTALMIAIESGHFEIVKYLVEHGADIFTGRMSALKLAQKTKKKEIIEYLKMSEDISKNFIPVIYRLKYVITLSRDYIILVLGEKMINYEPNGTPLILLKKAKNNKYTEVGRTKTLSLGSNCPADGFQDIAVKGDFFTIEQVFCADRSFVSSYATFKYNPAKGEFMLDKYSEVYVDRFAKSQDVSEVEHYQIEKNKYVFEDFTEDFVIAVRNNNL